MAEIYEMTVKLLGEAETGLHTLKYKSLLVAAAVELSRRTSILRLCVRWESCVFSTAIFLDSLRQIQHTG